jgi:hypothetical protein
MSRCRIIGLGLIFAAMSVHAQPVKAPALVPVKACIFDPTGANGPFAQLSRDLAIEAQRYGMRLNVKIYLHEHVAAEDFKAGQCDLVGMSTLRARQFNKMVGSIDSPGNLRSYAEIRSLLHVLANPAFQPMTITGRYQVIGVMPIGALYVMTRDRSINSIEKAAGKRIGVLDWDPSQSKMISALGAQPVPSDITSYGGKFNNGQVDIIAAPAIAYEPLELYKGIGKNGGVIRFPLLHATATIMIRRDFLLEKMPDLDARIQQLQAYGLRFLDAHLERLKQAEKSIPTAVWVELTAEEKNRYSRMVRQARIAMTKDGVYDTSTMNLLKRVRCKHDPANEECSLFDE